MNNRFKSPIVWLSVMAQICIVIAMFSPQMSNNIKIIGTSLIEIATILGVLNNPTSKETF